MTAPGSVGPAAKLLGFAGLLPQAAAVAAMIANYDRPAAGLAALAYATIILSFLGGIWWGFATRRDAGQGTLAGLAVLPSLVGFGIVLAWLAGLLGYGWAMVAMGSAVALTLLIDRTLASRGEAPAGWMRLRVPLSIGLGAFTILAGVLGAGTPWLG